MIHEGHGLSGPSGPITLNVKTFAQTDALDNSFPEEQQPVCDNGRSVQADS